MLNSFLSLWGSRDCQPLKYRLSEGLFLQTVCAPILGLALAVCSVVSLSVSLSRGGCGGPQADPRSRGPPAHPSQGLCWHLKPLLRLRQLTHSFTVTLIAFGSAGPQGRQASVCVQLQGGPHKVRGPEGDWEAGAAASSFRPSSLPCRGPNRSPRSTRVISRGTCFE